ncbi:hypothetical protein LPJ72_005370 [Coemansia sp. Benny D160-2]|nr:hypothetical protein LPJ72_005370 [Coemansia sp. Benny D160-2]
MSSHPHNAIKSSASAEDHPALSDNTNATGLCNCTSSSGLESDIGPPRAHTMTSAATSATQPEKAPSTRRSASKKSSDAEDRSGTPCPSHSEHRGTSDEEAMQRTWSAAELLEVRARERTFDGAYWRTSIGLFGASLIILRVFGLAFFPVGIVFLVLGLGFLAIGLVRRHKLLGRTPFADEPVFVTSGGTVVLSGAMCISAYVVLLVLLLRM